MRCSTLIGRCHLAHNGRVSYRVAAGEAFARYQLIFVPVVDMPADGSSAPDRTHRRRSIQTLR